MATINNPVIGVTAASSNVKAAVADIFEAAYDAVGSNSGARITIEWSGLDQAAAFVVIDDASLTAKTAAAIGANLQKKGYQLPVQPSSMCSMLTRIPRRASSSSSCSMIGVYATKTRIAASSSSPMVSCDQ